jgi:hypothetical protein
LLSYKIEDVFDRFLSKKMKINQKFNKD